VRILVTGSRTWDDLKTIAEALSEAWWVANPNEPFIIVHGDCYRGADVIAGRYARYMRWTVEPHPADWERYGKRAGFIRNIEMVKAGADACLAFIRDDSRGASHCADAAERHGIPTRRYRA
jgi:hypothetical protein